MLAVALVLTQLWFPHHYYDLARDLDTRESVLVLERDLVLLALLALLALPIRWLGSDSITAPTTPFREGPAHLA